MSKKLNWVLYRLSGKIAKRVGDHARASYSQCGEDLIVRFVFDALKIPNPTYIDIGAHHPTYLNNTYKFYLEGSRGVNVEPDPDLFSRFLEVRPDDKNVNVGVGAEDGQLIFYVMTTKTLNTFSEEEANAATKTGRTRVEKKILLPVKGVVNLLQEFFPESCPDFVSIDVEGLDYEILSSWDFELKRPRVVCVETIVYDGTRRAVQRKDIDDFLQSAGYFQYAHTHINGIYIDSRVW